VVSNSQVIGCKDRLRNDLYCVGWGVKLYSTQLNSTVFGERKLSCVECCFYSVFVKYDTSWYVRPTQAWPPPWARHSPPAIQC